MSATVWAGFYGRTSETGTGGPPLPLCGYGEAGVSDSYASIPHRHRECRQQLLRVLARLARLLGDGATREETERRMYEAGRPLAGMKGHSRVFTVPRPTGY